VSSAWLLLLSFFFDGAFVHRSYTKKKDKKKRKRKRHAKQGQTDVRPITARVWMTKPTVTAQFVDNSSSFFGSYCIFLAIASDILTPSSFILLKLALANLY
jgi:uncharacterized membrane protein